MVSHFRQPLSRSLLFPVFVAIAGSLPFAGIATAAPDNAGIAFFESKIRPVLAENCYECHSASAVAAEKLKGGLQIDTREGIRRGGDTGPAVVPARTGESLILKALRHESDLEMPPDTKLSPAIVADFVKWIEMGAPDPRDGAVAEVAVQDVDIEAGKKHWAFRSLANPVLPKVADEESQDWVRTEADRFIRKPLAAKGIASNPVADPRTLIRRATFDLTGLPPAPEWVETFVADAEKDLDGAWGRLIDELLASEHYGERWGRHWLDLVRFAESNGYAFDRDRPNAWRYRDWVIRALNAGMPYDEFIRLQLSGDILAGTDWDTSEKAARALELVSATGLIVGGPFTTQQTQKERERSRYEQLDDMVHTLGTSMLGLTVGCARCHDHKYDPVGMHDYYEWAAMFADVGFADVGVDLQPHIYRDAKAAFDKVHQPLVASRAEREEALRPGLDAFVAEHKKQAAPVEIGPWQSIGPFKAKDFNVAHADPFGPEIDFKLDPKATWEEAVGDKKETRAWTAQPAWKDGAVHNAVLKGANSVFYLQRDIVSPRAQSIALSVSGNDGIKVWVNGFLAGEEKKGGDAKADELKLSLPLAKGRNQLLVKIANGGGDAGFYFQTSLEEAGRVPKAVEPILKIERAKWNDGQVNTVFNWFRNHDPAWRERHLAVVLQERKTPKPDLTLAYAAKTRGTTYQFGGNTYKVYHLHRGNADNKKDEARPGFLRVLSRESEGHWLGEEDPKPDSRWTIWKPSAATAKAAKLEITSNGQVTTTGDIPDKDTYVVELPVADDEPTKVTALRIEVSAAQPSNFVLSQLAATWIPKDGEPQPIAIEKAVASFVQNGFNAGDILAKEIHPGRGWAISGGVGKDHELALILKSPTDFKNGTIRVTLAQESQWPKHLLTHFAFSSTDKADARDWAGKPEQPPKPNPDKIPPREALAQWITDVDQGAGPLLARVIVNRLWQHHFGRGIVATPSDFGTRGERPSHPELLDWLAQQLIANDWQLKPIHRLIMTSSVYMQGGADQEGGLSFDPENLLYWRKPARRLEAEAIRDNLLAVSGKLDPTSFGKGTLDANSPRRSIYLTVKRGALIEMLQLFDAPDAMQSIGNREISTVAPQALAMLNSAAVRNWAIDLSKRARPNAATTVEEAVEAAYKIAYARPPKEEEKAEMVAFIERQKGVREGKEAEAEAFQDFCHLLLCANEFVYVD